MRSMSHSHGLAYDRVGLVFTVPERLILRFYHHDSTSLNKHRLDSFPSAPKPFHPTTLYTDTIPIPEHRSYQFQTCFTPPQPNMSTEQGKKALQGEWTFIKADQFQVDKRMVLVVEGPSCTIVDESKNMVSEYIDNVGKFAVFLRPGWCIDIKNSWAKFVEIENCRSTPNQSSWMCVIL